MSVQVTAKLTGYLTLAALGLAVAIILGLPAAALVALPFALALIVGLAVASRPRIRWRAVVDPDRALEDDTVELRLDLQASRDVEHVEVRLEPPALLDLPGGGGRRLPPARARR